jgi:hypothetical protein
MAHPENHRRHRRIGLSARWCLWLVDATPSDLRTPALRLRLHRVAAARAASPTESVRRQAATPALFTQIRQPGTRYLALPEVSSENREYVPGRYYIPATCLACPPPAEASGCSAPASARSATGNWSTSRSTELNLADFLFRRGPAS